MKHVILMVIAALTLTSCHAQKEFAEPIDPTHAYQAAFMVDCVVDSWYDASDNFYYISYDQAKADMGWNAPDTVTIRVCCDFVTRLQNGQCEHDDLKSFMEDLYSIWCMPDPDSYNGFADEMKYEGFDLIYAF